MTNRVLPIGTHATVEPLPKVFNREFLWILYEYHPLTAPIDSFRRMRYIDRGEKWAESNGPYRTVWGVSYCSKMRMG